MYVNLRVKNAKNFALQANVIEVELCETLKTNLKLSALVKTLFTASLTEPKNACITEVCSVVKNSYKVQDFVLIPEKRRLFYFRIQQL